MDGSREHGSNAAAWAAYERPAVMREYVRDNDDGTLTADLLVHGVHCASCTWAIETTLNKLPGVVSIEANPVTTRAELRWDPHRTRLATLLEAITDLGFRPMPFTGKATQDESEKQRRLALRRLLVAGLGMMQVTSYAVAMYAGAFQGMDPQIEYFLRLISLLVATPIVFYSGAPFFQGAWRNIRSLKPGMDLPVALAIGGAWSASVWNTFAGSGEVYFDSATMFVFFLSGTRYLEAAGRHRALDLTHSLAQQLPCTAMRLTASGREEVGVMELEHGDRVLVPGGVAFPADGMLDDRDTRVDESMLTGESLPVSRQRGDAVIAGTVNTGEAVTITVEKTGPHTVLAQIGRLVTQAGRERPQLVELTDRIASVFVSIVIAVATVTGIVWWQLDPDRTFGIVLSVLVVTCPCALALATPAAFTVATSRLARDGFLVRRAGALQRLAQVSRALFDKTGTLTDNHLRIEAVHTRAGLTATDALRIAAALEAGSAHPIARAFRHEIAAADGEALSAGSVQLRAGRGLEGLVEDAQWRIGTATFAAADGSRHDLDTSGSDSLRQVFLGDSNGIAARFDIAENLREGAADVLRAFADQGIQAVIASGDQARPVKALARRLGNIECHAELLPEDKLDLVRDLQQRGERVAAFGDGVNDSPVLAGADVAIAMGSGTSVAQHSADCVWLGEQLGGIDRAFSLARRTMRVVKQNLAWALGYNLLAIPLAVTGTIEPWMAALGMSLSSLLVMLNALRLGQAQTVRAETPAEPPVSDAAAGDCCSKQPA